MEDPTSTLNAWIDAFNAADRAAIVGLYAPAAVLWGTFANSLVDTPEGLAAYFGRALQATPPARVALESVAWQRLGPVVVASGVYRLQVGPGAVTAPLRARFTFCLTSIEGRWRIANHHSSVMPGAPSPANP